MTTKSKILAALDIALDDIAEERLLDILLDSYAARKTEIERLHGENAREREAVHHERERMAEEHRRMRSDPLYGAVGEYHFISPGQTQAPGRRYMVRVQGQRVSLCERQAHVDIYAQPTPAAEANR